MLVCKWTCSHVSRVEQLSCCIQRCLIKIMYKTRRNGKSVQFAELASHPHWDNGEQSICQFLFVGSALTHSKSIVNQTCNTVAFQKWSYMLVCMFPQMNVIVLKLDLLLFPWVQCFTTVTREILLVLSSIKCMRLGPILSGNTKLLIWTFLTVAQ